MQIGNVTINGKLALAPMAGVTDLAFRHICREHGAALTVTEMVSAKALCYQDKKTPRLLELGADEHPAAAQIFGHEPDTMAEGAKLALEKSGCDIIDINMGCPAPKIVNNGDGSALMKDPELASKVIAAVVNAVDVPVTVKFRKGWDEKTSTAWKFAKMAEQSGAQRSRCTDARAHSSTAAPPTGMRFVKSSRRFAFRCSPTEMWPNPRTRSAFSRTPARTA